MTIQKVGVIGCGLMGSGITQVTAQAGYPTVVREINDELLQKGLKFIEGFLSTGVERGKVTEEEKETALNHISGSTSLQDFDECDIIIEAVVEKMEVKKDVFRELDTICKPETLFCSNTSSLSITEMAKATDRPERFAGLHFFNPAPLMPLIELVRSILTSETTVREATGFAESLGKTVVLTKDQPGFIVNRLLVPYLIEAIRAYEQGLGNIQDIDASMKLGCGYPMGPFLLLDLVGIDTTYFIANIMFDEMKAPHLAPPPLMKRMVLAGWHGKKTGIGFYDYSGEKPTPNPSI